MRFIQADETTDNNFLKTVLISIYLLYQYLICKNVLLYSP